MQPDREYEVGYAKPPKHSQFKKGQSGNPKGRPAGAKNVKTLLGEALHQTVAVTENGQRRNISKAEAMATQLANRSAQGDARATETVLRHFPQVQIIKDPAGPQLFPNVLVVLPDNGRDPELTAELRRAEAEAQQKYFARKQRQQERQEAVNENQGKEVA
jgi:uncharacterized protein DUF5681